jgi:endonuclease I
MKNYMNYHHKAFLSLCLALLSTLVFAQVEHYYDSAAGMSGQTLRNQLRVIISSGHTSLGYDTAKERLFQNIDNVSGVVRCVYTGRDYNVGYSYSGSTDPNTEHSYCQSWFEGMSEATTMRCDLHHLFPTNMNTNSSRGNLPLDVVSNHSTATTFPVFNDYHSYRGSNAAGRTVFEPADQHKGDVARALLYMMVRYNAGLTFDSVNMFSTLIAWNYADTISTWERNRNNSIYTYQHNRNPFIDHPEYIDLIWNTANEDHADTEMISPILTNIYPNPFSAVTRIQFKTDAREDIAFSIYDLKGRQVKSLRYSAKAAGEYYVEWNGNDDQNARLANGMYFVRADNGRLTTVRKVLLVR